jgi:hypothetical protein
LRRGVGRVLGPDVFDADEGERSMGFNLLLDQGNVVKLCRI